MGKGLGQVFSSDPAAAGASKGTTFAHDAIRNGVHGLGGALQNQPQQPMQGGGANFNVTPTQLPDSYYQALQPQQQIRSRALFGQ